MTARQKRGLSLFAPNSARPFTPFLIESGGINMFLRNNSPFIHVLFTFLGWLKCCYIYIIHGIHVFRGFFLIYKLFLNHILFVYSFNFNNKGLKE